MKALQAFFNSGDTNPLVANVYRSIITEVVDLLLAKLYGDKCGVEPPVMSHQNRGTLAQELVKTEGAAATATLRIVLHQIANKKLDVSTPELLAALAAEANFLVRSPEKKREKSLISTARDEVHLLLKDALAVDGLNTVWLVLRLQLLEAGFWLSFPKEMWALRAMWEVMTRMERFQNTIEQFGEIFNTLIVLQENKADHPLDDHSKNLTKLELLLEKYLQEV
eukprot:GHVN01056630.1.p2 GENE.GHVN01056630.1~~GHVN01056630.1.p2  ORF type:complete len:231 (+),score=30.04 GHVN01056630.1:25-693(+)